VADHDGPDAPPGVIKARWRARLLAARAVLPAADRAAAGAALTAHLLAAPALRAARVVAAFVPVGSEPGGAGLPDALRDRGLRVLLPVVLPDGWLDWAQYDGHLVPARYGLREPAGPRLGTRALAGVDAVLAPGLAVDRRGVRLGRGAGYYDRALAAACCPVAVLLYDTEVLAAPLPAEPHDRRVTAAVTPLLGWVDLR
jgi:5-formyltetrahydrofolate cyclo-ligase